MYVCMYVYMHTEISCYLRVYRASRGCLRGPVRGFIVITRRRGKQTGNGSGDNDNCVSIRDLQARCLVSSCRRTRDIVTIARGRSAPRFGGSAPCNKCGRCDTLYNSTRRIAAPSSASTPGPAGCSINN